MHELQQFFRQIPVRFKDGHDENIIMTLDFSVQLLLQSLVLDPSLVKPLL